MNKIIKTIDKHDYVSFDVFDTLIERTVKRPADIFYNTGLKILGENQASEFQKERIDAEKEARARSNTGEVSLKEIYGVLGIKYIDANKLLQEEIEQEYKSCIEKKEVSVMFNYALQKGKIVYLISDMYLSSLVIGNMLNKCGINGYKKLYISNEYDCNKITGELFEKVIDAEKIERDDIVHIGDSVKADYFGAKKAGISSILINRKNRFERLIIK